MPSLLDLCPELLEEIVTKLESVEDVISLGSSCTDLARIVGQERIWRVLIAKTELVEGADPAAGEKSRAEQRAEQGSRDMGGRVRRITTFLGLVSKNKVIFSLLHQKIYSHYPATDPGYMHENIIVSFPPSSQLHAVSGLGLHLLALTGKQAGRHLLHEVSAFEISSSLLLSLASLEMEKTIEMWVIEIYCTTEEEGLAMVSLLKRRRWGSGSSGMMIFLEGEVGGRTWERLDAVLPPLRPYFAASLSSLSERRLEWRDRLVPARPGRTQIPG